MSSDTERHRELLSALKAAQGKEGFDHAVTAAFEHVFEHLERLNSHVSASNPEGQERSLKAGESSTLR